MTPSEIAAKITPLYKEIAVHIYSGSRYVYETAKNHRWTVQIEWKREGTHLQVEKQGATLDEAMYAAWSALVKVAHDGLPSNALQPPVESKKIADLMYSSQPPINDEIPF